MANYAYVPAILDNSLTILDVTNPAAPAFKGNIMGAGVPNYLGAIADVAKIGNYCYCGCMGTFFLGGDACLTIIDVSNPALPTFVSTLPIGTSNAYRFVFVSGNYAYVTDFFSGLYIVDISNPAAPAIVGSILLAALGLGAGAYMGRAYKLGNYCYLHSAGGDDTDNALSIIDVSNPAAPTLTGSISGVANWLGGVWAFPSGNYCYCASTINSSLTIIDISNPALPTFKGNISGAGMPNYLSYIQQLWKEGNYCYCGCVADGFTVIDVSNPALPTFVSNLGGFNVVNGIVVYKTGSQCYIGDPGNSKVWILDISNPAAPAVLGSLAGAGAPNYLNMAAVLAAEGSWVPPPTPYNSPPCIIDFKGLLDCIGWKWRAGGI